MTGSVAPASAATSRTCSPALADGTVGVAQVRELARARANPRAGDQLAAAEAVLLEHAQHLPFEAFKTVVRRWEQLADADGAHRDHDDAHTGRHAAMCELGDSFHLDARFGAAQGVAMRNILDQLHTTPSSPPNGPSSPPATATPPPPR